MNRFSCFLAATVLASLIGGHHASATNWDLIKDWDLYDQGRNGPGMFFGPEGDPNGRFAMVILARDP